LKLKENTISVHYKIFPIPIINLVDQEDALNQFLCTHKIISIHKEIIDNLLNGIEGALAFFFHLALGFSP
jgi:hypothetical protein